MAGDERVEGGGGGERGGQDVPRREDSIHEMKTVFKETERAIVDVDMPVC